MDQWWELPGEFWGGRRLSLPRVLRRDRLQVVTILKRPHWWSIFEIRIPSRGMDDPIAALVHVATQVSHFFGSMETSFVVEQVKRYKERKWWVSFCFIQL